MLQDLACYDVGQRIHGPRILHGISLYEREIMRDCGQHTHFVADLTNLRLDPSGIFRKKIE